MSGNKKYYWLKLKEDFFRQKEIKMLRKLAGGDTYTVIYLKMLLLSLDEDGKIYYDGIANNFSEELALEIDEEVENVQVAVNYLMAKGLMEQVNEHESFMSDINSMIGSESSSAKRVRKHRQIKQQEQKMLQSNDEVTKSNTEKEIEKELDIEKEKRDITPSKQASTDSEFESLWKLYPNKKGKPVALKAYKKALKDGATFEEIEMGIQNYLSYIQNNRISIGYVKHGSTWFNQQGWLDEYESSKEEPALGRAGKGVSHGGLKY